MKKANRAPTSYKCQSCGYETLRWLGKCPDCGAWNTLVEEARAVKRGSPRGTAETQPESGQVVQPLAEVPASAERRLSTHISELDRVLGGGVVPGSLILVGGEPGVGKSTLLLQVASAMSAHGETCLYVAGEESLQQIRLRAERLGAVEAPLLLLAETEVEAIEAQIETCQPRCVMIDSIQTVFLSELESAPGTVTQVRESTAYLARLAKATHRAFFLVGHVTKEGSLAGPKVMEHIVDTVLYFEGEQNQTYKILRAVKNRFGSTNEMGLFEMQEGGLKEVTNPSYALLSQRPVGLSGTVVVCTMEGTRPLLVEVQALVAPSYLTLPRRVTTGVDPNRASLLLAVLEKRGGFKLGQQDVFINVAGGVRIHETAADLGVALAVASSYRGQPIAPDCLVFGEVGLAGEVRAVGHGNQRLLEGARLGFSTCVLPAHRAQDLEAPPGLQMVPVRTVREALDAVLAENDGINQP